MSIPIFNVSNLDGSNGFRLDGEAYSYSGFRVDSLGDINGDGFDDVTVQAFDVNQLGISYVVFGQVAGFSATKDLSSLDGHDGFRVHGMTTYNSSGIVIDNGGDINGDGIEDMIVSESATTFSNETLSHAYVVFGKTTGFEEDIDLTSLDGEDGFSLQGASGSSDRIERAGDINGDGFADVIVSSVTTDSNGQSSSSSAVVFGRASGFDPVVDLTSLDGQNGFLFKVNAGGQSVYTVHVAGDVNGDGLADVIVGDPQADPHGDGSGSTYVVFGRTSGFDAVLDLSSLDGQTGFRLDGEEEKDYASGITSVGDINGDGFDDVVIDAPGANKVPNNYYNSSLGARYIVFGKASGFDAHMDLSSLDGNNGFRLNGPELMRGISSAGDINGDGSEDILISSSVFARYSSYDTGYVVFGKASGFDAAMDIGDLDGSNGFQMTLGGLYTATSFSHAGDVNGDGFDDLIAGVQDGSNSGVSYLVLGQASGFPAMLSDSDDSIGVRLEQEQAGQFGYSVSDAGDVNGDGFEDVIVSAPGVGPNGENTDLSYVIFGRSSFQSDQTIRGTSGDDTLTGTTGNDRFEAGDGNDSLLGRGGADVFEAGAGDDAIRIGDLTFASIDGGDGNDALHLAGANLNLDLTTLGSNIHGIETICLYGRGDNTLTLSADSLLNLSDSTNTLKVHGNSGDHISLQDDGWVDSGSHGFYHTYTHDEAVLLVGANVTVEFV